MPQVLLIESRDPFESNDVSHFCELAQGLEREGHEVTVFLAQNAVLAARPGAKAGPIGALAKAGIKVLADDFALAERGIKKLADGITSAPIDVVVDHLEAGHKTLWH
jgi:sulfur relay (sulfurtransferase) complex TusBCD TusD component (DsrE family)